MSAIFEIGVKCAREHTTGRVQHMAVRPVDEQSSSNSATVVRSDEAVTIILAGGIIAEMLTIDALTS
jgi:hypothetical protein